MGRSALLALLLACLAASAQNLRAGAQQGLPAPRFSARPINGPAVALADLTQPVGALVALLDINTQEGLSALAFLQQSQARLAEMKVGLVVLAVNVSQASTVQRLIKNEGLTIPIAHDANRAIARQYAVTGNSIVLVDPEGLVFNRYDVTEDLTTIGPLALGGARDMVEKFAQPIEETPAAQPPPATAATGPAPIARPSDEETRRRIAEGWRLVQAGYVVAALADARLLAEQRGTEFTSSLWLAYVLEVAQLYREAAAAHRQVLALRPQHVYSLQAIARIDPTGRYLPRAELAPAAPAAPAGPAASSQGPNAVGD